MRCWEQCGERREFHLGVGIDNLPTDKEALKRISKEINMSRVGKNLVMGNSGWVKMTEVVVRVVKSHEGSTIRWSGKGF